MPYFIRLIKSVVGARTTTNADHHKNRSLVQDAYTVPKKLIELK